MTTLLLSSLVALYAVAAPAPETVGVAAPAPPVAAPAPAAAAPAQADPAAPPAETSPTPAPVDAPLDTPVTAPAPGPAPSGETVVIIPASDSAAVAEDGAPAGPPIEAEITQAPAYQPIVEPIPAPPPPLSTKAIRTGPWRGRWWIGLRLGVAGPLGGQTPARPSVGSVSGGLDFGYRINNWIGLGTGLSGQLHEQVEIVENTEYGPETRRLNGDMLFWDPLFARVFLPLKRRFQPFAEIGGGLAAHERAEGGYLLGAQIRSGVGLEGWLTPNLTLGVIGNYRWTRLTQKFADGTVEHPVGHSYQALAELGFHW